MDHDLKLLPPGAHVEVRDRFERHFWPGFEITEATGNGYRVRRMSDGSELPAVFGFEEIRPD